MALSDFKKMLLKLSYFYIYIGLSCILNTSNKFCARNYPIENRPRPYIDIKRKMSSHLFNKENALCLVVWCSFKHFPGIFLNYEIILLSKSGGTTGIPLTKIRGRSAPILRPIPWISDYNAFIYFQCWKRLLVGLRNKGTNTKMTFNTRDFNLDTI